MGLLETMHWKVQPPSDQQTYSSIPVPVLALSVLGGIAFLRFSYSLLFLLLDLFVLSGIPLSKYGAAKKGSNGQGSWAIVTGATDGIGKEFALQLARKGFNIVLASRTPAKLQIVEQEIAKASPGTKVICHAIDFSSTSTEPYEAFAKAIQPLDVGVLVNNVGKSHNMPVPFFETDEQEIEGIININIIATLRVTKIVSPGMVERKRGLILNLGSFAGQFPSPLLTTYSGSKSFLSSFSRALGEELRRSNVTVQLLNTYFVVSSMSKIRKSSALVPTPEQYVSRVLAKIGRQGGAQGRVFEGTLWPLQAVVDWAIGNFVSDRFLIRYTYDQQASIRKRAIRKAEKAAKGQ